jgi:predicted metal-dependent HD superfamily phosphohydrolase
MATFEEFEILATSVSVRCDPDYEYERLVACYAEPHREYHDLRHIDFCLKEFFKVRDRRPIVKDYARGECEHPWLVEAAIWYHDSVYDTHAKDNEERSADFAISSLRLRKKDAVIVRELILDTKHAAMPKTFDGRILADIDLAGLGKRYEDFVADGRKIREEYAWVGDEEFMEGRLSFLTGLLRRPTIYWTPMFQKAHEKRAQMNLRQAVIDLRK